MFQFQLSHLFPVKLSTSILSFAKKKKKEMNLTLHAKLL